MEFEPLPIAIVSIMRDEIDYLVEWVAYHRLIGIDTILIYDNGGNGQALVRMAELGTVVLVDWPSREGVSPQLSAYVDATLRLKNRVKFVGYFDADEFLVIHAPHTVSSWLSSLGADVGAVAINQRVFGSSGHLSHDKGLVTQRFQLCCLQTHDECRWFKTICRPELVSNPPAPHRSVMTQGRYILPNGKDAFLHKTGYVDASGAVVQTDVVDFSIISLNHYIVKSRAEFLHKKRRGGGFASSKLGRSLRYLDEDNFFWKRESYCNRTLSPELALKHEEIRQYAENLGLDVFDRI